MNCKFCGHENSQDEIYCSNCGEKISSEIEEETVESKEENLIYEESTEAAESDSANAENDSANAENSPVNSDKHLTGTCKNCGAAVKSKYCTECGSKTDYNDEAIGEAANYNEAQLQKPNIISKVFAQLSDKELIKTSVISAVKMLAIGLIISFILFILIKQIDGVKELYSEVDGYAKQSGIKNINILPNFIDLFGASLQIPLSFEVSGKILTSTVDKITLDLKLHLLLLIFIPFIMILIAQFRRFKNSDSTRKQIVQYALSAIFFSILMNVILIFNAKKFGEGYEGMFIGFTGRFKLIPGLIICFIIVFGFQFLLSLRFKKESLWDMTKSNKISDSLKAISIYLRNMKWYTVALLIAIFILLFAIFIIAKIDLLTALISSLILLIMLPFFFVYQWMYLTGNSLITSIYNMPNKWTGLFSSWDELGPFNEYLDFGGMIYFYILLSMLIISVIYIIIEALNKLSDEKYFIKLGYVSIGISAVNTLIGYFGTMIIRYDNGNSMFGSMIPIPEERLNVSVGYPIIRTLLFSTLIVFVIGVVLYYIRKNTIVFRTLNFIERKKRIIKISYLILMVIVGAFAYFNAFGSIYDMMNVPNIQDLPNIFNVTV